MSTSILSPEKDEPNRATFYFNEFYGGEDRGICHQITTTDGAFVQLTRHQMLVLVAGFLRHFAAEFEAIHPGWK